MSRVWQNISFKKHPWTDIYIISFLCYNIGTGKCQLFYERKINLTQTIDLVFPLKEINQDFKSSIKAVNIVHPSATLGGNLTRRGQNSDSISLNIPRLKFKAKFRVLINQCNVSGLMTVFNLACSLQCCVILIILNEEEKQLKVSIVCDNENTFKLLQEIYNRLVV